MGAPPPLVGYNTNVRHKGKLFHIQTEDSGIAKPHVITHLFADGGRIVATRKTQYTEHVAAPDREDIVRRIMKEQHKAMFIALRDGVYDGPDAAPVAAPPAPVVADATTRSPTPHSGVITGVDPALSVEGIATPVDPSVVPATSDRAPAPAAPAPAAAAPALRSAPPKRPSVPPVTAPRPATPPTGGRVPTPPPPRPNASPSAAIAAARARRSAPPPAPRSAGGTRPPSRPAQPRPAAPPSAPKSIFGQDLISEKSLDEVILSYLSRELDDK